MVADTCGISVDDFHYLARSVTENSGRERTTAFVYAVGWTQHTLGAQFIRTAAIVQLLLGNMGRPGGGIMALRGHASIQGSTDIPTLYNILPGYLAMPMAGLHDTWDDYIAAIGNKEQKGFWANADTYAVSLLKSWWGEAATPRTLGLRLPAEAEWGARHVPDDDGDARRTRSRATSSSARTRPSVRARPDAAPGHVAPQVARRARLHMIESATFWKDGPEIATGELRTEDIQTEVFFLPAAAHTEKSGSFTQTQRMLQWHHKAVAPPGDCAERAAVLLPSSAAAARAARRLRPTRATVRCSTSPGTIPSTSTARSTPRPSSPRSTAAPHRRPGRPAAVDASPR